MPFIAVSADTVADLLRATHDFPDPQLGKAILYGIYDLAANTGWVGCSPPGEL